MTEVDTVMLEGGAPVPASPRQITAVAETSSMNDQSENDTSAISNNVECGSMTENNPMKKTESSTTTSTTTPTTKSPSFSENTGVKKTHNNENVFKSVPDKSHSPMDVDEDDYGGGGVTTTTTEQECEEDSQVTSSSTDIDGQHNETSKVESSEANLTPPPQPTDAATENSNSQTVDGNDFDGEAEVDAATERKGAEDKNKSPNREATTNNISENSQSCDSINDSEGSGVKGQKDDISDIEDDNSTSTEQNQNQKQSSADGKDVDVLSESHFPTSSANITEKAAKDLSNASPVNLVDRMDVDEEVDPLSMDNELSIVNPYEVKNGVAKNSSNNNGAVVDLDDDSDEENCNDDDAIIEGKRDEHSNGSKAGKSISVPNKGKSVCSDSDGAVVIGSDSENEVNSPKRMDGNAKKQNAPPPAPAHESEDDDDDCVVIEDDSPLELTPKNDQVRRKSVVLDSENNSDDSQPPSKRQRRVVGNQLTIKDARSLLPAETSSSSSSVGNFKKAPSINDGGVYPINITPAGGNILTASGPPKLAPIGSGIGPAAVGTLPGLVGVNSNANLLPGLTDDMFVLEAPSFIVPYIYEKPPSDSLKDIVKEIESKYELTKEDLTEADKSDEFDMMTEQNKEDRDPQASQGGKKKKKRRFAPDVDDSWSEESEEEDEDDEDDDSEAGVRTKVLIKEATDDLTALKGAIKPAAAVAQSITTTTSSAPVKPGQENYFESPLGKFFMDIGVGLVQEFVQTDLIRLQKRKMRKSLGKNMNDFERAIAALSGNLEASKKKNSPFKFTMKRCEFCNFKSESALAMAHHYETPHMNGPLYKCNFCTFEIRNATEIVYHMEAMHNIKARLIKPLPYHQCPNCGFEDNGRAKLARHQPVCAKKFRPELNLAPPNDWEAPAKIPRIKPRHGLVGTATAYQAMAAQAAAQKAALATIQQQQQQQQQARNLQAAAIAAQNAVNKIRGRPPVLSKAGGGPVGPNGTASVLRGPNPTGPRPMATNVVLPNNYQLPGNQIIPATNALHTGKKTSLPGQPSISITPLPRQSATPQAASPSTSKTPPAGIKPGRNPAGSKAQFVICEICDGYIKDLEQLRNHMQWMHEVKIHPKMIYNRPPLNCQKCQFRFFTDQGLERHLLGSHGLVTSSMQEAANKGKDAGRCPVCGRMYQWKLLNHVARDHHMTLKPAHLSYKCTVCTATFGMYKQFETHVYTAHSTVAKKAMDSKKNNAAAASGTGGNAAGNAAAVASAASSSGISQRSGGLSAAANNDALLKPLKINDEITIIPQPASKPRITNMESHVID